MLTNNRAFEWPTEFKSCLVREEFIYPNIYNITVSMSPNDLDGDLVKLGFKRLKYFIHNYLNNGMIIKQYHPLLTQFDFIKNNTIQTPDEPHDYSLGLLLFHKFSAILENTITVTQITIDSSIGDHIKYTVDTGNQNLNGNSWWNRSTVETNDLDVFPEWDDSKIQNAKFEPKVLLGGKNENRSIR
jgi:hypothetical protein